MVDEARLEETDVGLIPSSEGWFVLNAKDARWNDKPGRGISLPLTGDTEYEAETFFPMLGMNIRVVESDQPTTVYHWENEVEDFLVLDGEGVLIVEGEERPLQKWDFVHCPPGTRHAFAGKGTGRFVLLCVGTRTNQASKEWGGYEVDPVASKYGASPPEDTDDPDIAYSRFPDPIPSRYQDGWLPS